MTIAVALYFILSVVIAENNLSVVGRLSRYTPHGLIASNRPAHIAFGKVAFAILGIAAVLVDLLPALATSVIPPALGIVILFLGFHAIWLRRSLFQTAIIQPPPPSLRSAGGDTQFIIAATEPDLLQLATSPDQQPIPLRKFGVPGFRIAQAQLPDAGLPPKFDVMAITTRCASAILDYHARCEALTYSQCDTINRLTADLADTRSQLIEAIARRDSAETRSNHLIAALHQSRRVGATAGS